MDAEVSPEVVLQTKSYPACLADERFFPRVDDVVLHQRSFQLESLPAHGASERPLLRMHSLVRKQMSRCPETLPTGGTGERFFSGVNGLMLLQDALGSKSFPAGVADERPDSGVDRLVTFQQVHLIVRLLANGALEGLLCFEFLLTRPHFRTFLLSRWLHCVGLEVSLESLLLVEAFVTLVAGEKLVVTTHVLLQLMSVMEAFVAFLTKDSLLLMLLSPVFLVAVTLLKT